MSIVDPSFDFDAWFEEHTAQLRRDIVISWRFDMRAGLERYGLEDTWRHFTRLAHDLAPRGDRTPSYLIVREVLAVEALFDFVSLCRRI